MSTDKQKSRTETMLEKIEGDFIKDLISCVQRESRFEQHLKRLVRIWNDYTESEAKDWSGSDQHPFSAETIKLSENLYREFTAAEKSLKELGVGHDSDDEIRSNTGT